METNGVERTVEEWWNKNRSDMFEAMNCGDRRSDDIVEELIQQIKKLKLRVENLELLQDIEDLVRYNYESEKQDYCASYDVDESKVDVEEHALRNKSQARRHHIFCSIARIKFWLKKQKGKE